MKITPTFTRTGTFSEKYFVWTFIIIVLLISLLDLTGWVFDIRQLKSVGEDWIPMKVITAFCFIFSALSLIIIYKKQVPSLLSKLPVVFGVFVFVIGALSCSVHYMLLTTGNEPALAGYWFLELFLSPANRMAFLTAGNFEFIGIILVLFSFHRRKLSNLAHVLIIPVLVISYLVPISYILGVHSLHSVNNISVALNTGIAFLALCLAILFVRPDTFLMKVFTSRYAGGLMSRQMIPVLMLLPVIIGWFRIYGEKQGIYESEVGVVLVALTYTVCFVMLIWISARSVNFRDKNRRKAEEELKRSNQQNEFLGNIVHTSSQPFAVGYTDGKLGLINKAFEQLTGYTGDELHTIDWAKTLTPPEWNMFEEKKLKELSQTGLPVRYEKEYIRKDGSRVPIELLVHLIKDSDETPLYYYSFITDITERKKAEQDLQKSEERVKLKLKSILSPEGNIANLELKDIIDTEAIQSLMNNFNEISHMPMAIIDLKGNVIVGSGWQNICVNFHRAHPESCKNCIESDVELSSGVPEGEFKLYKCKNNLWDMATPVMIGGEHKGNLFMGQFFFDDELPDYEYFRVQAAKYHFNETKYLKALDSVPRLTRETLEHTKLFFMDLTHAISQLSYSNIKLARTLTEREQAEKALHESNLELKRFNRVAVGRELRMIELKKEINQLYEKTGQLPRYELKSEEI